MGYELRSLEKDTSISSNNGFWVNVLDLAQQNGWNPEGTINGMRAQEIGLEKVQAFGYKLRDMSAVRYLFYPKHSTEYGKIYSGLVGKETKNITRTTGDLDILEELAFKEPYKYIRGGEGIIVTTEVRDNAHKRGETKGEMTILRPYKLDLWLSGE